jgi:hypothetical protein
MSFAIPKLEPECVHLEEAAVRIVERAPSLDIDQVRKTLCDAIAYGRLRVQSDDGLNDALTLTAFRARQRGFIRDTFADTWQMWLERGAEISWKAGLIFVPFGDDIVPIRLPRVLLADVFELFDKPEEKPTPEEAPTPAPIAAETAPASEMVPVQEMSPQETIEGIKGWFLDIYFPSFPPGEKPSEPDQVAAAAKEFPGVKGMRDIVRSIRPEKWSKPGPNPQKPRT